MNARDFRERFAAAVARPDPEIDLIDAALCIAGAHNPGIDLEASRRRLHRLGEGARFRVSSEGSVGKVAAALCRYLAEHQGFRGNDEDYYNPDNSFLDRVLETRRGIPITLALVYIGVGRALGLDIRGVGFPGHFLVKVLSQGGEAIIDPFEGRVLNREECGRMLSANGQPPANLAIFLRPATNGEILGRMLNNLKTLYSQRGDHAESLSCTEWRLLIDPRNPRDLLDKGLLLERLQRVDDAIISLELFLEIAPTGEVAESVRKKLERLRKEHRPTLH